MANCNPKKIYRRNGFQESLYDEIAELEVKFRNAYIQKTLEAQLAEKEANRLAAEKREQRCLQLMALGNKEIMEREAKDSAELRKKNNEMYKKILEKQIKSKVDERKREEDIAKQERKILFEVDALMDKMYSFIKQKHRDLVNTKLKSARLIFDEIREIKKIIDDEKQTLEAEKEIIFLTKKNEIIDKAEGYRDKLAKNRQSLIDKVSKLFIDMSNERNKREAVIADLLAEEIHEEIAILQKRDQAMIRLHKDKSKQLANDLMDQMRLSVECETRASEQDKILVEKVMAKVMEDESMVILTSEARKRKQVQYKEDLQKLISDRMRNREEAFKRMRKEELNECQGAIEARKTKIKEGRRKLIEEHTQNIAGYLQEEIFSPEETEIVKKVLDECRKI